MPAFDSLWSEIIDVGRDSGTGGYRRFAWTTADASLREWFVASAAARGMSVEEDRNGNLWAWWLPPGWTGDPRGAFVTGSHLDSVPDGGAFDGPLGVVSAFIAVDRVRERGVVPRVPIAVTAFSDEEGARFGVACVGSRLATGSLDPDTARRLTDVDGTSLAEAMTRAGRDPQHIGVDPTLAQRVGVFVELHVEQGRALDLIDQPIALAGAIWPHGRWRFTFGGEANHAGTTRLVDRRDPMLTFATAVHAARAAAFDHDAVATFGKILAAPNGTNAIPSQIRAWLDARAATETSLTGMVDQIRRRVTEAAGSDGVTLEVTAESVTPIVEFPEAPRIRLQRALTHLGELPVLPTQAGHDAGILAATVPTAMLFVRNPTGISHSPEEFATIEDCRTGADVLADVMADWTTTDHGEAT